MSGRTNSSSSCPMDRTYSSIFIPGLKRTSEFHIGLNDISEYSAFHVVPFFQTFPLEAYQPETVTPSSLDEDTGMVTSSYGYTLISRSDRVESIDEYRNLTWT